jgi:hypothetical protein
MLPTTVRVGKLFGDTKILTRIDARGHYTIGKEMVDSVIEKIRRVAGESDARLQHDAPADTRTQTTAPRSKVS